MRVYVAGPLSTGTYYEATKNIRHAIDVGEILLSEGYAPYVPHYSHFWNLFHRHTWEAWMKLDYEWLRVCDALLRLPGESKGADQEVKWAHTLGIPVCYTLEELDALRKHRKTNSTGPTTETPSREYNNAGGPELRDHCPSVKPSDPGGVCCP